MQCCYAFMQKTKAKKYFNSLESFGLIFSGFCHDVSHTGHNNDFEKNSLSKLALRYHDKSVNFYYFIYFCHIYRYIINFNFIEQIYFF